MPTRIELREIDLQNFNECVNLKVADSQTSFVATNVMSIAQSKVCPTAIPMAIYANDEMVGFTLFGFLEKDYGKYHLFRLMIDEKYQGKGYGTAAARAVIEIMRKDKECREIYLSFVPENVPAQRLYESVGFQITGELNEGEIVMKFVV